MASIASSESDMYRRMVELHPEAESLMSNVFILLNGLSEEALSNLEDL